MADESRKAKSSGSLTWLWMILALISVVGFLAWLGMASEPTSVAVVETEEEEAEIMAPGASIVPKDTLAANKPAYEAQLIQVPNVVATGSLGPRVFWGELGDASNQVPILIRLDSVAAAGIQTQMGAAYTVAGLLFPMSDSLAGAWYEEGLLEGEGERMQAGFADYYIQASHIRPTRDAQEGSGAGSDTAAAAGDTMAAMADTASG